MPLPIQVGSVTSRLRNFFRIRGRSKFLLDEIVVPTVQVQDLTKGPYQAGVTPGAGTGQITTNVLGGSQVAILLNPTGALVAVLPELDFEGRSFSITELECINRGGGTFTSMRWLMTPRANVLAAGAPTALFQLQPVQEGDGIRRIPVVIVTFASGGIITTNPDFYNGGPAANGSAGSRIRPLMRPEHTIGPAQALVIEDQSLVTSVLSFNVRGFYQEQPN